MLFALLGGRVDTPPSSTAVDQSSRLQSNTTAPQAQHPQQHTFEQVPQTHQVRPNISGGVPGGPDSSAFYKPQEAGHNISNANHPNLSQIDPSLQSQSQSINVGFQPHQPLYVDPNPHPHQHQPMDPYTYTYGFDFGGNANNLAEPVFDPEGMSAMELWTRLQSFYEPTTFDWQAQAQAGGLGTGQGQGMSLGAGQGQEQGHGGVMPMPIQMSVSVPGYDMGIGGGIGGPGGFVQAHGQGQGQAGAADGMVGGVF